jgi:uncharacterized protein (DUF697 family)
MVVEFVLTITGPFVTALWILPWGWLLGGVILLL